VRVFLSTLLAGALAACSGSGPPFKNTDITGADYGKDFTLTDHTGRTRTLADFRGKVVVVFFGYTRCPDVCPTTLADLKSAKEQLARTASECSAVRHRRPERDTPQLLAKYVPAFDPSFLGLYGDAAATARVAREFKVFTRKHPEGLRTATRWTTPPAATCSIPRGGCVCWRARQRSEPCRRPPDVVDSQG